MTRIGPKQRVNAALASMGRPTVAVRKGLWGYYLNDATFRRQRAVCVRTLAELAADPGKYLPVEVKEE